MIYFRKLLSLYKYTHVHYNDFDQCSFKFDIHKCTHIYVFYLLRLCLSTIEKISFLMH